MKWKLGGDNEQRLNRIKDAKDKRCTDLRKNTDDVEVNISNLEQEEKMCVERLTYSKMMSQRVLYQLERNIGTQTAHERWTHAHGHGAGPSSARSKSPEGRGPV